MNMNSTNFAMTLKVGINLFLLVTPFLSVDAFSGVHQRSLYKLKTVNERRNTGHINIGSTFLKLSSFDDPPPEPSDIQGGKGKGANDEADDIDFASDIDWDAGMWSVFLNIF